MKIMSFTCIQFLLIVALVAVSQTWADDETLVLHLKLDEGKGKKVKDSSMYGNDGVINGAEWVDGKYDGGLEFDVGTDVEIPDAKILRLTEAGTIAVWIRCTAKQEGWARIVDKSFWQDNGYDLALNPTGQVIQWEFFVNNSTYSAMGETSLSDNKWHHILVTFDNSKKEMRAYVDGVTDSEGALDGQKEPDGTPIKANDLPLRLGRYSVENHHFIGKMDDVIIYNRAVAEDEIEKIMSGELAVNPTGNLSTTWGSLKELHRPR